MIPRSRSFAPSALRMTASRCLSVLEIIGYEERLSFRKVDRHGAAHLRQQLGRHFPPSVAAGPVFHPLHHHPADERRNPLPDRKSVVEGKRVDLGGRRIIKKKKK